MREGDAGLLFPVRPAVVSDMAVTQDGLGHEPAQSDALTAPAVIGVAAGVGVITRGPLVLTLPGADVLRAFVFINEAIER